MSFIARPLHYVLKVGDLQKSIAFFRDILLMTVLRHEVFEKGCDAACNGPYDGKWSKTMIGYGPENDHFVLELTYNYSIDSYLKGNTLDYIKIRMPKSYLKNQSLDTSPSSYLSPDGYKFILESTDDDKSADITEVSLRCNSIQDSVKYWDDLLGMKSQEETVHPNHEEAKFNYPGSGFTLKLTKVEKQVERGSDYGRIAFSCPTNKLGDIQKRVEETKHQVLTSLLSLDTPGKATVQVVILADPSGHEICFVGDEGFRELSQVDQKANELIEKSIREDQSKEWFKKKNKEKQKV